ncbi:hypothetical protein [Azospirillum sp. TSO5]|uniref:hypothetical protein n=1 Tax=Azospirillum sp. TSO5 TaxID=716760 RepID=UPI0013049BB1|nr:hypothetical protein [Azospirillum sp. TSO5]
MDELDKKLAMVERILAFAGQSAAKALWEELGLPGEYQVVDEVKRPAVRKPQTVEKMCERIVEALRRSPTASLSLVELKEKTQPSRASERDEALKALIERGTVTWTEIKTATRKKTVFTLASLPFGS